MPARLRCGRAHTTLLAKKDKDIGPCTFVHGPLQGMGMPPEGWQEPTLKGATMTTKTTKTNYINVVGLIQIALIVLKAVGIINCPWWVVLYLFPVLVWVACMAVLVAIAIILRRA